MTRATVVSLLGFVVAAGCGRRPEVLPRPEPVRQPEPPAQNPQPPKPRPRPLEQRDSFAFDGVPFPDVIGKLARDHGVKIGVSRAIPIERWARHRVTLRMGDVTRRALLDWLVRPLEAEYAIEEDGAVWLTRGDDLLLGERLEVRTYVVPTHVRVRRPLAGRISFAKEQRLIIDTLERGLRYLLDRRKGCRLAFHGEQDVLVARLPAPGHARLEALLDAMRHGTDRRALPRPALRQLRAKLRARVTCDGTPRPVADMLARAGAQAKLNFGWDAGRLGSPVVTLPRGEHELRDVLRTVTAQTKLARYVLEPGRGIWLYLEGQDTDFPESGATLWDRMVVRAFDVRPLLERGSAESVIEEVQKQVDPGQWQRGFPSAAVFTLTARLIVVHDAAGQRRVASVVQAMLERAMTPPAGGERR